ncbi:hypothetical protein [Nakamurella endophytica]|uniref:Uncharacterized protein n=1 Tax=Nakamurella endophytica TaxID=1748367 RepID=A0A917WB10_9ACTN|nr:hypothetical protein [Nakamurella endophytica]GGL87354.1 hypothetical protein GCM10011594_03660 [Nakamurella endophytica]
MSKRLSFLRAGLAALSAAALLLTATPAGAVQPSATKPAAVATRAAAVSFSVRINGPLTVGYHRATEFVFTVTKGAGYARDQYAVLALPRNVKRAIMDDYETTVIGLSNERVILEHAIDPNDGPSVSEYHYYLYGTARGPGRVTVATYASAPDPDRKDNIASAVLRVR